MRQLLTYVYPPLTAFYLFMVAINPIDQAAMARRDLTLAEAQIVGLSIAIPMVVIWWLAFYGALHLHEYSRNIRSEPDGPQLHKLSIGVIIIALYLPVRMVTKTVLSYFAEANPSLADFTDVTVTYVHLVVPLAAFIVIGYAARDLRRVVRVKTSLRVIYALILVFISISVAFCYLSFAAQDSIAPNNWLVTSQAAIPLPVRAATVTIPYLFMWFIGLLAAYEIYLYQRFVKGVFYRQTLRLLTIGLVLVILASIAIQFLTAAAGTLQHLPIGAVLAIAFSLILLLGVAFVMISRGVSKLRGLSEA